MSSPEIYERRLGELIDETASHPVESKEFLEAAKNVEAFSKIRAHLPEPEADLIPVTPLTRWGKLKAGMGAALDNETARTFIKAGGAFAGVALVVWSTVHRDHVMDKQAMQQANQRPI
jgi:hypothetical protein